MKHMMKFVQFILLALFISVSISSCVVHARGRTWVKGHYEVGTHGRVWVPGHYTP